MDSIPLSRAAEAQAGAAQDCPAARAAQAKSAGTTSTAPALPATARLSSSEEAISDTTTRLRNSSFLSQQRASGDGQAPRRGGAGAAESHLRRAAARTAARPRGAGLSCQPGPAGCGCGGRAYPGTELSPDSPTRPESKWDAAEVLLCWCRLLPQPPAGVAVGTPVPVLKFRGS